MSAPPYLQTPPKGVETFGQLRYAEGYYYITDAVPVVYEMAKRVFPGCDVSRRAIGGVCFRATRRAVGELNWLMMRYPLVIEDSAQYGRDLESAVHHAQRRQRNQQVAPVVVPPTFDGELYPFQAEGVSYMLANRRVLLADDMGLGKTVTAIAGLASAEDFPALIVVPANVRLQWQRQIGAFLNMTGDSLYRDKTGRSLCHVISGLTPYALPLRQIHIIHYGLLRGWKDALLDMGFKAIVFDEIQELRHIGTQKYSVASLLASECDTVWGLSGTPIYNYGIEIWSVLNILDYHCLGDRESFTREWCTGYGSDVVQKPEVLRDHLKREGLMIRRRKSEVQSQLPPKRRLVQVVDHDEGLYTKLIAKAMDLAVRYDSIHGWKERGEAALQIDGGSRRAAGVSKASYVGEFVESLIAAGEKPLVYAWHHDVHDIIADRLSGRSIARITGKQSQAEKDAAVMAFAKGNLDAILLSLRATAGLDGLQGQGTCVVFAELDWSPAIHSQCEDRLHRVGIGDLDSVLCYYMTSSTGYDGVVMNALGLKVGQFIGIMGDKAETEDDRVMAQQAGRKHLQAVIDRLRTNESAA